MKLYDQSNAACWIFSFKHGLLSSVAHDLRLSVTRFSIEVGEQVVASFDAASLVVDTPMRDGRENPDALSAADKAKIARQIRDDVLHSARYPTVTFRSSRLSPRSDGGYDLGGELSLHGVSKHIDTSTTLVDGRQRLELTLHQPDFGVVPFQAMLGTLKIRPDVRVLIVA